MLVTHDAQRAARVADTAIVLADGCVVSRLGGSGLDSVELESAYLTATEGRS